MHNELRKLLPKAVGTSHFVIVQSIDVRGFTSFAQLADSSEAALFLKKVYVKLIDKYFTKASFYKPTGDGLLVVFNIVEDQLRETVVGTVRSSIEIVEQFNSICAGDPMINFRVPERVGIGLARGSATSITSGDKVLDYSGRPLNLASRLTDMARESGIVFDESFGFELLPEDLRRYFKSGKAYVKGIAETTPLDVYYNPSLTTIPVVNRRPFGTIEWSEQEESNTVTVWKRLATAGVDPTYDLELDRQPTSLASVQVHVKHQSYDARGYAIAGTQEDSPTLHFSTFENAGRPTVRLYLDRILADLENLRVKDSTRVSIVIQYPIT